MTGPARIQVMPAAPETSHRYWESHCPDCGIYAGMAQDPEEPWLVEIRDSHNKMHARTAPESLNSGKEAS